MIFFFSFTQRDLAGGRNIIYKVPVGFEVDNEVDREINMLKSATDGAQIGRNFLGKLRDTWHNHAVRKALLIGVGMQALQQFLSINTISYYTPKLAQVADYLINHAFVSFLCQRNLQICNTKNR
jgi:hypothetical protein